MRPKDKADHNTENNRGPVDSVDKYQLSCLQNRVNEKNNLPVWSDDGLDGEQTEIFWPKQVSVSQFQSPIMCTSLKKAAINPHPPTRTEPSQPVILF